MSYTQKFQRLLDVVPRVGEDGKDIAEPTRIWMALRAYQDAEERAEQQQARQDSLDSIERLLQKKK